MRPQCKQPGWRACPGRKRPACKPKCGCIDRQMLHGSACSRNPSRAITTWRARIARILAKDVEHVTEVETDRVNTQFRLIVVARSCIRLLRHDREIPERPATMEAKLKPVLRRLSRGSQPRDALHPG